MTITRNTDGTFAATFTQPELAVVVGLLGLTNPNEVTELGNTVGRNIYNSFFEALEAAGGETDPFSTGVLDIAKHPQLAFVAVLAGALNKEKFFAAMEAAGATSGEQVQDVIEGQAEAVARLN